MRLRNRPNARKNRRYKIVLFDKGMFYSMFEGRWNTARHQQEITPDNDTWPKSIKDILEVMECDVL